MINLCTKYEVSYEDMKGDIKCGKGGGFGLWVIKSQSLEVTGNSTIRQSAYKFLTS